MKRPYQKPKVEFGVLEDQDIITTSDLRNGGDTDGSADNDNTDW